MPFKSYVQPNGRKGSDGGDLSGAILGGCCTASMDASLRYVVNDCQDMR